QCVVAVRQGGRQIDGSEARTRMAAGYGADADDLAAQLFSQLRQLFFGQGLDVSGRANAGQEPDFTRRLCHQPPPAPADSVSAGTLLRISTCPVLSRTSPMNGENQVS